MELRQLKYFLAIVDFGSISKASSQLNVAQPALSQQIMNLEHELGTKLLIRSARGAVPTPAGQRLYKHAQMIRQQIELAQMDVAGTTADQVVGHVTIGLPTSTAALLAVPLLLKIRAELPGVKLRMIESLSGHLLEFLMKNKTDIAVQFRDEAVTGIQVDPMLDEELFVITADPAKNGRDVNLQELATLPLVLPGRPHMIRNIFDDFCEQNGLVPNIVADVDSLPALRGIAASGVADTILSWGAFMHPQAPGLYLRRFALPRLTRPLSLCYPQGAARNEAIAAAQKICKSMIRELVEERKWRGVTLRDEFKASFRKR